MATRDPKDEIASIERDLVMTVAKIGGGEKARLLKQALNQFWTAHPLERYEGADAAATEEPIYDPPSSTTPIAAPISLKEPTVTEDLTAITWREILSDLLPKLPRAFSVNDLVGLSGEFRYLLEDSNPAATQIEKRLDLMVAHGVLAKNGDCYEPVP